MKEFTVTRGRRVKFQNWKLQKKPNKSILRKSTEEEEGNNNNNEFNNLPVDVISSIFIRCPVNTLSMLRCVSKSWNDLIASPLFVHSHLEHSTETSQLLFLQLNYLSRSKRRRLRFVSVDMEGNEGESNELYAVTLSRFPCSGLSGFHVSAGLVFFSMGDHRMYLCNPVKQQFFELPKCSPTVFDGSDKFGFGYLRSTKEYKVVRIFNGDPEINDWKPQLRGKVLTLNGIISSEWKEIAEIPPCGPYGPGLLVNECMYWPTNMNSLCDQILSFDFENGKFLTISCPSSYNKVMELRMVDLKGMLCLPDMDMWSSTLDLWILKDKISCIWVKECSINLVGLGCNSPILRTWNEEIIVGGWSNRFVFYDLKGKCFRERRINIGLCQDAVGFEIYQKTLFSLGNT
ncbi:F-box protein At3g07870-like isoform X1 [Nicotiana tomentosiformis]|uniref:F-box protein At3g07870-like isoform X1 n=1 Tax=Nicotiana tomentosiformis TaxID=4098 RepID=UPI00388C77F3